MKHSILATEFWFTLVAFGIAVWLLHSGFIHDGVVLLVGTLVAYGLSRGVAKRGYGKALNKPNHTSI